MLFQNTGKVIYPLFHNLYNEMELRTGTGSWLWNRSTDRYSFSPNFCRIVGIAAPEDLVDVYHAIHPDDQELLSDTIHIMRTHQYIPEYEYRVINGDRIKYIHQYGKVYTDENGNQHLYGFWQDISRQKEREQVLVFHEKLVDVNIDGIFVLDKNFRILLWNRYVEVCTGLSRAEVTGRNILDVQPAIRNCVPVLEALLRALNGFASFVPADKNFCGNGDLESHYIPVTNTLGNVTGILCIQHDVKHRIKTETELRKLHGALDLENRKLKRRNAELQALAYIAGSDLREPLRRMYTSIETMVNQDAQRISERERIQLRQLQASVQRVGLLADDMLSFSRLDTEKVGFAEVDLNEVLSITLRKLEAQVVNANAIVTAEPLPVYRGHKNMLVELFRNLIGNAIKFQHPGAIPEVLIDAEKTGGNAIRHADADPAAAYLVIRFSDNGIGIEEKYRERIFKANMRINRGKYTGAGIGLTLSLKIAEMHSGFIIAESQPGRGSTFYCYLREGV